jgi:predicted enzyme related to lactoylglutathione lyase
VSGDLVYFMISTTDAERARAFYGGLFGWRFTPGSVPDGFNVEGSTPPGGLHAGGETADPQVWFDVDDIESACARVVELGGTAGEIEEIQSGWMAACTDDQGSRLNLWADRSAASV